MLTQVMPLSTRLEGKLSWDMGFPSSSTAQVRSISRRFLSELGFLCGPRYWTIPVRKFSKRNRFLASDASFASYACTTKICKRKQQNCQEIHALRPPLRALPVSSWINIFLRILHHSSRVPFRSSPFTLLFPVSPFNLFPVSPQDSYPRSSAVPVLLSFRLATRNSSLATPRFAVPFRLPLRIGFF